MARTIDDIIRSLEDIIADCIRNNSRLGYFAALYLKVTQEVKDGIAARRFQDNDRMGRFDVLFASRYLDAYAQWHKGERPTESWAVAFEQAGKSSVLVLQHLFLGMNAHINLDLGIAAAEICGDQPIENLKTDFDTINTILASLTYQVLNELDRISPLLSLMGMHATNHSPLIQFSLDNARDGAWCFAEDLVQMKGDAFNKCIAERDATIKQLGESIVDISGLMRLTIWVIHLFELKNPARITKVLNEYKKEKIIINKSGS